MGEHAIGIVPSEYDGDGTLGVRYIKDKGGTTFAQDSSAEVDDTPIRARAWSYVDVVLAPEQIAEALIQIASRVTRVA